MKKILFILLSILTSYTLVYSQSWDNQDDSWGEQDDSWGSDDDGTQSTDNENGDDSWNDNESIDDSWTEDDGGDFNFGGSGDYVRSARPETKARPYQRFTSMPYDSSSQLITYMEVVEVIVPERFLDLGGDDYSLSDSLYQRALVWMQTKFGKREAKSMIDAAGIDPDGKEGQTIKAYVNMPLAVQLNEYKKVQAGIIKFDMELRFKDERYRYKFNNFVHVSKSTNGKPDDVTYMEYYLNAKKNTRGNDQILIACNNHMNNFIDDLKTTCAATPFIDDDDW
ncbi:MAG: DUF4468 domain-containing protein [Bacteroidia bacterium]|mgnify:CR=1 FL=1|nr:DUF4468 domain-containing protein [Bacteroidia bacterium]MDG2042372.1 DUF4468 domain-containing protein [Bacteroidia bacterium]|tara:strand:- start:1833 stop:2675 length:843 start_codon:yes stop_codon:yes gene_type:complete